MPVLATTTVRTMTRRDIATAMVFDKFRYAFEHAAPIFDAAAIHEIAARDGSWDEVRAAVASNALPSIGPVVTDASSPTDRSVMTSIPGAWAGVWSAPR